MLQFSSCFPDWLKAQDIIQISVQLEWTTLTEVIKSALLFLNELFHQSRDFVLLVKTRAHSPQKLVGISC